MPELHEKIQQADWKAEKHVPVIECPDSIAAGTPVEIKVSVGKEIAHPNTTEHHIRWITLAFQPDGGKFVYDVARFEFNVHGESTDGANKGPAYCEPVALVRAKFDRPGTLFALAYCNIHGLWESSKAIAIA